MTLNGHIIMASLIAKLLGVVFDQELRWREHVQWSIRRAAKTTLEVSGLRRLCTWGARLFKILSLCLTARNTEENGTKVAGKIHCRLQCML